MSRRNGNRLGLAAMLLAGAGSVAAQVWDVGARARDAVGAESEGKLAISFEQRGRYESRTGNAFGKDPDIETGLIRTRFGMTLTPVSWLKISGMVQDSRAPWYGSGAPSTVRDSADLQEAYFELFGDRKTGFGMTAGRMMMNYGDARLIGSPQWGNLARTYDHARLYYRTAKARFELLYVSPVKIRLDEFNRAVPGEHVWGVYNVFQLPGKKSLDVYALRHDQNRPGGFTGGSKAAGTDRLGINTFGARWSGPLNKSLKFALEAAAQTGKTGPARHRGAAWAYSITRRWTIAARPFDLTGEYKFASGTKNPGDATRTSTFDQLFPANHDKFGHQDLFGWRNLHNARSLASFGLSKRVALNAMYDSYWLANLRDGIYNGSGKLIVRSAAGTAGRHVGQEADLFLTCKLRSATVGAGYGRFFKGDFVRHTTPGVGPTYLYVFHNCSF